MAAELTEQFLDYIRNVRRYSERTCDIYSAVLSTFVGFVQAEDDSALLESLNVNSLRAYEVYLMEDRKESARTVSQHISVLSSFCRYLMKRGLLENNPAHLVARPKVEKRLPEFYREESMNQYFNQTMGDVEFGTYDRKLRHMIVSILANTGIRRSELIGLNVSSVDFSRQVLTVHGKGDKMREIPLIASLCEEISLYLSAVSSLMEDAYSPESPLLRTRSGSRLYPVLVDRAVKRELGTVDGITGRKSPHVLRHTLATELLGAGSDINSIKEFLGHSSLAATQVYTHNTIERLQKVYETAHPRAKNGGKNGD